MGNFNDPPVPSRVAPDPLDMFETFLSHSYLARDGFAIRPWQRVSHERLGDGTVEELGSLIEDTVWVQFDTGRKYRLPARDLWHV